MCTASIIPIIGGPARGVRIVFSRDEQRSRAPAMPPAWRTITPQRGGHVNAVWPIDPESGGTWIAAGEHGLALFVVNVNLEPAPQLPSRDRLTSRGLIIPALIASEGADDAVSGLKSLDLERFAPFGLLAVEGTGAVIEARWDRRSLSAARHASGPVCVVSSGLGDSTVLDRLPLFESVVRAAPDHDRSSAQDAFHRHVWPDRPEISVLMDRADARTVSVTTVELLHRPGDSRWTVAMRYTPLAEHDRAGG